MILRNSVGVPATSLLVLSLCLSLLRYSVSLPFNPLLHVSLAFAQKAVAGYAESYLFVFLCTVSLFR